MINNYKSECFENHSPTLVWKYNCNKTCSKQDRCLCAKYKIFISWWSMMWLTLLTHLLCTNSFSYDLPVYVFFKQITLWSYGCIWWWAAYLLCFTLLIMDSFYSSLVQLECAKLSKINLRSWLNYVHYNGICSNEFVSTNAFLRGPT